MARIDPLTERKAGIFAKLIYIFARRRLGRVPEPLRVMAHHGGVLTGTAAFELALDRARRVSARLKDLAGLRAATLVGCPF